MATKIRTIGNAYLKKYLSGKSFSYCLNAGCGNDSDREGLKYSEDYIKAKAIEKLDQLEFPGVIKASLEKMPFEDNKFDLVFCNWLCIEDDKVSLDINNLNEICLEIKRVMVAGGQVIISYSENNKSKSGLLEKVRNQLLLHFQEIEVYKYETRKDIFCGKAIDWNAEYFIGRKA